MVNTRSQTKQEESIITTMRLPYKIQFVNQKKNKIVKENHQEENDDIENDRYQDFYDFIPESLMTDKKKFKQIKKLLKKIIEEEPKFDDILIHNIEKNHKIDILEWLMIYENTPDFSDEKRILKKKIQSMIKHYQKYSEEFKLYETEIKELEENNKDFNELHDTQFKIVRLNTNMSNKNVIYRKFLELQEKEDIDEEFYKIKSWIQTALRLPFDNIQLFPNFTDLSNYLKIVQSILDKELFGMQRVKEQILLFIHDKLKNPNVKGCCLGLIGEPGVGKTSIARCLSKVLNLPFEQITFGGINSADYLRGYDYTYIGSRPGEIVRCLTRMNCKNGILFFDEYEKISQNPELISCLLHITDFTQNDQFRDNFLSELTIDLSSIWFIYSMNELPKDNALKDRIFFIEVEGYTEKERVRIFLDYLLPKHLKNLKLDENSIMIPEKEALYIIQQCFMIANEKGVRLIEKALKDILHKISFLVTNQNSISCSFLPSESYFPLHYPIELDHNLVCILLKSFLYSFNMDKQKYHQMYL